MEKLEYLSEIYTVLCLDICLRIRIWINIYVIFGSLMLAKNRISACVSDENIYTVINF